MSWKVKKVTKKKIIKKPATKKTAKKIIKKVSKKAIKPTKKIVKKIEKKVIPEKKEIKKELKEKTIIKETESEPVIPEIVEDKAVVERTPNGKNISDQSLVEEMKTSYLDYAMSVIVVRALPDVRDGLKPVHRRILYAMWKLGLKSGGKFRKSATVVGEVLGKYHPHGDTSVYDSMVRMAQEFSLRYMLVNGQGNFGSVDGDHAAAMRYTESKLQKMAEEMLFDIEKDTVNFRPNYDGSQKEPVVLPAKLPNLLLNGSMGIAVGMATNIPPHNLGELVDATCHLIDKPQADIDALMEFVKGPDFPTGGIVYDVKEMKSAYSTGRGGVVIRAKTDIQETKRGFRILITEIPYQVNKSTLVEKIATLVKDKKIKGITDLRDESNKDGIRVVIDLKDSAYPKKVLNALYKHTQLQEKFHFNMVALVDGLQPRLLNLKEILEEFIKHRQEVITRRITFDLNKAKDRAHILEGLVMALEKIDAIIKTIKQSKDKEVAKVNLMKKFKFSERQTIAILEMRLQQLANLERLKLEEELKEKKKIIKELTAILKDPKKILKIVKDELEEIKEKYGDERRTRIIKSGVDKISTEDMIPKEDIVVIMTKDGYIKRMSTDNFHAQNRGGKGVIGSATKEEDIIDRLFACTTHSDLLFFTSRGRVFQLKSYEIPVATRQAKGQNIVNFLQLAPEEKVTAILPNNETSQFKYLMFVTKNGLIKKTEIDKFANVRRSGLISLKLKDGDSLRWVKLTSGKDEVILITANGQSIRTKEKNIRSMGRSASGVRGIRLKTDDEVVGMSIVNESRSNKDKLAIVMEHGFGKRTELKAYKIQGRGGSGIKTAKVTTKTGKIVSAFIVDEENKDKDIIIISSGAQVIRLALKNIPTIGRATQGVRLMRFKKIEDKVVSVTVV
ncbi:DNA gyrase subunit A [bacterium]|nr:DNA gyrase subunit A [bacterium]